MRQTSAPTLSLAECFESSPPHEKRPQSANSPQNSVIGPPRMVLKQPINGLSGHPRQSGSPIGAHLRKHSAPCQRPRKQFRRSLSMFEKSDEITQDPKPNFCLPTGLDAIMDVDDVPQLQLPHFQSGEESLPRITKDTMINVLDGQYSQCYDKAIVVDCRFEYEFEGGHIEGAINANSKEDFGNRLFSETIPPRTLLIFHCEYSAHRAPIMAKYIRHKDRAVNAHQYPTLTFPDMYILDGGYRAFFTDHRARCYPQEYVQMGAKEHEDACERGLGRIKQQRTKLSRAQTYAFGQSIRIDDSSPTAAGRQCGPFTAVPDLSIPLGKYSNYLESKRMLSY